jgi:hypothetical protein
LPTVKRRALGVDVFAESRLSAEHGHQKIVFAEGWAVGKDVLSAKITLCRELGCKQSRAVEKEALPRTQPSANLGHRQRLDGGQMVSPAFFFAESPGVWLSAKPMYQHIYILQTPHIYKLQTPHIYQHKHIYHKHSSQIHLKFKYITSSQ